MTEGKCLCGNTVLEVKELKGKGYLCHCGMCRKQAAGPIVYTDAYKEGEYQFGESSTVSVYDSSDWAERAFCQSCGTFMYLRYKKDNTIHFNAELFDEIGLTEIIEIHKEDEPEFYGLIYPTVD
jgi:hypothetical protein